MGVLTQINETQVQWSNAGQGEPPNGTYTFRGHTKESNAIYQNDANQNVICIRLFNSLILIGDVKLSSLQHSSGANKGGANYGLTQSPKVRAHSWAR
jgi:hypothetical protein